MFGFFFFLIFFSNLWGLDKGGGAKKLLILIYNFLGRFTEDGSFIGQYGPKGRPEETPPIPTGMATYV